MYKAKATAEWAFGLLTGTSFGFGLAMIFVEPYWITPDSKARQYVAVAGVLGASAIMIVRNQYSKRHKSPAQQNGGEADSHD